ncbi:MAG: carboxypeptidase regulatory-like domain-containing protein, partial [Thermoplasmatales archaeon]|nr:carboxypeptidase regulatory-like domain-containing protein [Thermoplasmatales archaeon]
MLHTAVGKKFAIYLLILSITLSSAQMVSSKDASEWWNDNWSFRQKIYVPIDTTLDEAKFQAVDIPMEFDNSCWAKNETKQSVRVIFQESGNLKELESQIYDLNHSDRSHINACSLVFLIPEEASGKETYYVYYSDDEKPSPNYPNHIEISEAYYRYEPIPGFPFESHYYKIKEGGYIVYGVAQQGEFLGFSTAQQITKFKAKTEEVTTPRNGESWASFDYFYYYDKGVEDFSSTIDRLISKEVFVDGNLMVKFGIVSGTSREDFQ